MKERSRVWRAGRPCRGWREVRRLPWRFSNCRDGSSSGAGRVLRVLEARSREVRLGRRRWWGCSVEMLLQAADRDWRPGTRCKPCGVGRYEKGVAGAGKRK